MSYGKEVGYSMGRLIEMILFVWKRLFGGIRGGGGKGIEEKRVRRDLQLKH